MRHGNDGQAAKRFYQQPGCRSRGRSQRRPSRRLSSARPASPPSAPLTEACALGELFFSKNMARAEVVLVQRGVVYDYRRTRARSSASARAPSSSWNETAHASSSPFPPIAQVPPTAGSHRSGLMLLSSRLPSVTVTSLRTPFA